MQRNLVSACVLLGLLVVCRLKDPLAITLALHCFAQDSSQELEEAEKREKEAADGFLNLLERTPRRGTAFDRVYGFHVERGSLEGLLGQYRQRAAKDANDGTAWMMIGLVEAQRGRDAAAVGAFRQAEKALPDNPLASYYLGQSLVLVGDPDGAVEAFERAIERKPSRTDQIDIFVLLARVHQRAQRSEQALAAWSRLEKIFPGDARVQEQIAVTLVEEGQAALALPRFETLIRSTRDDYRKALFRIEAARLKISLGKADEGIVDLESLLGDLNPDSWLHRETRRRLEDVYLRSDDRDGLAKYYEKWLEARPEDVDSMARLSQLQAEQGRFSAAEEWMDKALALAPTRKELRQAYIDQLTEEGRLAKAVEQYAILDSTDPDNRDHLRDWGRLVLRDASQPLAERQRSVEALWRRLAAINPNDALVAAQVADLFRQAEMTAPALEFYRKAVELEPDAPQYREYLGEYYHTLKRNDEALAAWRKIAEGSRRTAVNVARLAEVLSGFGYFTEGAREIDAACKLDAKDFALQLKAAELHAQAEDYARAIAFLDAAEKLAATDEEREATVVERIGILQLAGALEEQAARLTARLNERLNAPASATAESWRLAARYYEALHNFAAARAAIEKARELAPQSARILATMARIDERAGNLAGAAEANRQLARLDRRNRIEYLTAVARLESQMGRADEAIDAGRELISAAPGNADAHEFFAELCFTLGRDEEGLDALRRAMRVNPSESRLAISLAEALAAQRRTDEAIELYWRAFERAAGLEERLAAVDKLADLHLQSDTFNRMLDRLEREQREPERRREMTICLAQAHHSAGDYGRARESLETLLAENPRDAVLLRELSRLCEQQGDLEAAVKHQEHLVRLAPGAEAEYRLASLLGQLGRQEESQSILLSLLTREADVDDLLQGIDGLLSGAQTDAALSVIESKLREQPKNWELLYRAGVALANSKPAEASLRFEAILELSTADDEPGAGYKRSPAAGSQALSPSAAQGASQPLLQAIAEIREATGLELSNRSYLSSSRQPMWTPSLYGHARAAAYGWLLKFAESENRRDQFLAEKRSQAVAPEASSRILWDWLCLLHLSGKTGETLDPARRLAKTGNPAGRFHYLQALAYRGANAQPALANGAGADPLPALPAEELGFLVECYREANELSASQPGALRASERVFVFGLLIAELARAGREEQRQSLLNDAFENADDPAEILSLLQRYGQPERFDELIDKWTMAASRAASSPKSAATQSAPDHSRAIGALMGQRGADKDDAAVLRLLDSFFEVKKAERLAQKLPRRLSASAGGGQSTRYVQTWYGGRAYGAEIDYPAPNAYLDEGAIVVLRTAHEIFTRNDVLSDLVAHVEQSANAAAPAEKPSLLLALSALKWWEEDREGAVELLERAGDLVRSDVELRLEAARIQTLLGNLDEALALLDSAAPSDHVSLQNRETMALELAARLNDVDRGRQAAQRLFGLRLDAESQLNLAAHMRRLGMSEMVEAITARAQRQAGNRTTPLASIMNHHLTDGRHEEASRIAHQILRQTQAAPSNRSQSGQAGQARQAALSCLSQTGGLKELIARAQAQLEASPRSARSHESLAEYHAAAGNADEALASQLRVVELRPDDALLRYAVAQRLAQSGKWAEASDQLQVAIKSEPRLLNDRAYEVMQIFEQAKRSEDLAAILQEIDLTSLGHPGVALQLVSNMMRQENQRSVGLLLFRRLWDAYPDLRFYLLQSFYDESLWRLPEVIDFARQAIMASPSAVATDPWSGFQVSSYQQDGQIIGVITRLLNAPGGTALKGLRRDVASAVEKNEQWVGGQALLALIDLRTGDVASGVAALTRLEEAQVLENAPASALRLIAQSLESHPEARDLAIRLYERSLGKDVGPGQFQYSSGARLIDLYRVAGRSEDARKLVLQAARELSLDRSSSPSAPYREVTQLLSLGDKLTQLNFPLDAIRLFHEAAVIAESSSAAALLAQYGLDGKQPREKLVAAIAGISNDRLAELAPALFTPRGEEDGASSVDLLLSSTPQDDGALRIESALLTLLTRDGIPAESLAAVRSELARHLGERPSDLNAGAAAVVLAMKSEDDPGAQTVIAELRRQVEENSIEPIAAGKKPNARQRQAAVGQIGLWLAARECLKREPFQRAGAEIAERALAAAERQATPDLASAILSEWGETARSAGDIDRTRQLWARNLELVLPLPKAGASPQPTSESQFDRAMRLAAEAANDFPQLSIQAAQQALAGGPPVADLQASISPISTIRATGSIGTPRRVRASALFAQADLDRISAKAGLEVERLAALWRRSEMPPGDIYDGLLQIVFCPGRPGELQLYARPLPTASASPRSVGLLLAEAAVAANRKDDLAQRIGKLGATGAGETAAQALLAQLGVLSRDRELATSALEGLTQSLRAEPAATNVQMALHAALLACNEGGDCSTALPLLTLAAESLTTGSLGGGSLGNQPGDASDLLLRLARLQFLGGNSEAGLAHIESYLKTRLAAHGRLTGDAGLERQRRDIVQAATETARAGLLEPTLEYLAQWADLPLPTIYYIYERESAAIPLWHAALLLRQLPADERFERLRDWSLPKDGRRSIRLVAGFVPVQPIPEALLAAYPAAKNGLLKNARASEPFDVLSNLGMLVDSAKESGRLDELRRAAVEATEEKIPRADLLTMLVQIAAGEGAAAAPALREAMKESLAREDEGWRTPGHAATQRLGVQWHDLVRVRATRQSPELGELGRDYAEQLTRLANTGAWSPALQAHLAHLSGMYDLTRAAEGEREAARRTGLKLWRSGPHLATHSSLPGPWWTAHENHVVHRTGFETDRLYFRYPLVGDFEFSCENYFNHNYSGEIGYGGLAMEPQPWKNTTEIKSLAAHDSVLRPRGVLDFPGVRLRMGVRRRGDSVQYLINGRPAYEDRAASQTSPWLHLSVMHLRQTSFLNPRLEGVYRIPREVAMSHGDRLEGWLATYFSEALPRRISLGEPADPNRYRPIDDRPLDWRSEEGVIHGRFDAAVERDQSQSALFYARPLEAGDTVRYEFFYSPGQTHVHPAIDRLALILREDGVYAHWLCRPGDAAETFDLSVENATIEPECRRGAGPLPLEAGKWNRMELSLAEDALSLKLGGQLIYERPLEATNARRFGLFHYKHKTDAQVRNVVMSGEWPESLSEDDLANLFQTDLPALSRETSRARHAMAGERFLVHDILGTALRAAPLAPDERYAALRQWVLPGDAHSTFRLHAVFTPLDPPPPAAATSLPWRSVEPGQLRAPVLDLLDAAAECGQLDSLAKELEELEPRTNYDRRSRAALQMLVELKRGDAAAAAAHFKLLLEHAGGIHEYTPDHERYPEIVAVLTGVESPELRSMTRELGELIIDGRKRENPMIHWEPLGRQARAVARWKNDSENDRRNWDPPADLQQWSPASHVRSRTRGLGAFVGGWSIERGEAAHAPASMPELLYLNLPLQGDFEVQFERTTGEDRTLALGYAGAFVDLESEGRTIGRAPVAGPAERIELAKKHSLVGDWAACRLVVKDGEFKLFVGDREVHSEPLSTNPDPWLAILSPPFSYGAIRNLRIFGEPEVPAEIDLSKPDGWRSDYFSEAENGPWVWQGNELVGSIQPDVRGSLRESIVQYHRPLLEDGVVSYEFFYEPGKTEVHPALDRMVVVLQPEGARLHWLTDAEFEQTGLAPDNLFPLPGAAAGPLPLKADDWNALTLSIAGGVATIVLNDQQIAKTPLREENRRVFGLFRYKDAAGARVRKIVHRGEWPKTLEPVEEQELANAPEASP